MESRGECQVIDDFIKRSDWLVNYVGEFEGSGVCSELGLLRWVLEVKYSIVRVCFDEQSIMMRY